ncbi:hypothetical protein MVEN_01700900 [Mycena venus]|uniref:G-protein coupled receptors family 2 profile 2 domain-containing protein n=1 Tax=Mycena venus TaxID=2733690 RepID=A0A8H7CQ34_9AGAR|nr:hypothetical protein MVEN_01700900 [Mycena venus]
MGLSDQHTTIAFDEHIVALILSVMVPGVFLTFTVLCAYAYTAWHSVSQQHLNRVSFRLLVYALIANFVFGIAFVIGTLSSAPSMGCSFVAFLVNLSLMTSAGMCFCMALNLQLVLVHQMNGQKMEKYYIIGTLVLCAACNIVPYASRQFGLNPTNGTCWFDNSDPDTMLRWLVGTQSFWVLLMATGEILAFLMIVGYIVSYEVSLLAHPLQYTDRLYLKLVSRRYRGNSQHTENAYPNDWILPDSPIKKYRNIILRIGLYPLVSCLINFSTCILDLYGVKNPIPTELNWRLGIADLAIYSVRPLIYGILAATDPAFIRAILALRRPMETCCIGKSVNFQLAVPTRVHIELQHTKTYHADEGGVKSIDTHSLEDTMQTATAGLQNGDTAQVLPTDERAKPPRKCPSDHHSRRASAVDVACQI